MTYVAILFWVLGFVALAGIIYVQYFAKNLKDREN